MKINVWLRPLSTVLLLTALPFMFGCATGAQVDSMSVQPMSAKTNDKLRQSLALRSVEGGKETYALWTSQISNENFKKALSQSLRNSGLESNGADKARYTLNVTIKDVDQPWAGFDMTVQTVIGYVISDKMTNKIIFSEDVSASHTTHFSEAFYGAKRLRLANEGSAKQNITQLISTIQDLDPDRVATPNL